MKENEITKTFIIGIIVILLYFCSATTLVIYLVANKDIIALIILAVFVGTNITAMLISDDLKQASEYINGEIEEESEEDEE